MTTTEQHFYDVTEADLTEIRQVALDYIESWYAADAARMEHCLHPDVCKRIVYRDPRGFDRLEPMSALALVTATRNGIGSRTPPAEQRKDITILAAYGSAASVKVESAEFIDFLHLGKLNGRWEIINILWEWY